MELPLEIFLLENRFLKTRFQFILDGFNLLYLSVRDFKNSVFPLPAAFATSSIAFLCSFASFNGKPNLLAISPSG